MKTRKSLRKPIQGWFPQEPNPPNRLAIVNMKYVKLDFLKWGSVVTYLASFSLIGIVIGTYVGIYEASGTITSVDFAFEVIYIVIGLPLVIVGTVAFFKIETNSKHRKLRFSTSMGTKD